MEYCWKSKENQDIKKVWKLSKGKDKVETIVGTVHLVTVRLFKVKPGHLGKDCPVTMISENKRFSRF